MSRPTTGDSPKSINSKSVSLAQVAIVTQVELETLASPINTKVHSGKEAGSVVMVIMTTGGAIAFAIAQGSDPDSDWNIVGDTAASPVTEVTPA